MRTTSCFKAANCTSRPESGCALRSINRFGLGEIEPAKNTGLRRRSPALVEFLRQPFKTPPVRIATGIGPAGLTNSRSAALQLLAHAWETPDVSIVERADRFR